MNDYYEDEELEPTQRIPPKHYKTEIEELRDNLSKKVDYSLIQKYINEIGIQGVRLAISEIIHDGAKDWAGAFRGKCSEQRANIKWH